MRDIKPGNFLGRGSFGSVSQVVYKETKAVLKELLDPDALLPLLREARLMVELDGAGGVPRLLAVCPNPPAMVEEFVGQTYDKYLVKCSVGGLLDSLLSIASRLEEIHAKGIIHNDLKMNNITFTGGVQKPVFHLIDLGWACRCGQVAREQLTSKSYREVRQARRNANLNYYKYFVDEDDYSSHNDKDEDFEYNENLVDSQDSEFNEWRWMAPEVRVGERVWPSGDVYSFGFLLECVLSGCQQTFLTEPLWKLVEQCTLWDPTLRSSLSHVAEAITSLKDQLLPQQLNKKFKYKG